MPASARKTPIQKAHLDLLGPFGLFDPKGRRIEVSSKKGAALLALLATGRGGIRSRGWLQDMLWGSREGAQAQASLRRELSTLRKIVNEPEPILIVNNHRVALDLDRVEVDVHSSAGHAADNADVFLEGLDIPGEEAFEDWLRTQRTHLADPTAKPDAAAPEALPHEILDRRKPGEGFLGRPMLAVLPFTNLTGDSTADYLAEGIAEELIEQLSRLRWIPIIGRSASFAYSSEHASLYDIGLALGARYIVEGRLRGRDATFGLAASITDAQSGHVLWARRMEFARSSTAQEIGGMLTEMVGALSTHLDLAEMGRAVAHPQGESKTADLIWRARWHHNQYTQEDSAIAESLLQQALAAEPHSAEAIVQLAYFRQRQIWLSRGGREDILELRRLAQRAIAADYRDGRGYLVAGIAELWLKRTSAAVSLLEQAIALNPSLAYAYAQIGAALYLDNQPQKALDYYTKALRLEIGEQYSYYVLAEMAICRAMMSDWEGAIRAADQSLARRIAYWYAHVIKIFALAQMGNLGAAEEAFRALKAAKPRFRVDYIDWVPFTDRKWPDRLKQCLGDVEALLASREAAHPQGRSRAT